MKLILENWNKFLNEAAMGPKDLKDAGYYIVYDTNPDSASFKLMKDKDEIGVIYIQRTEYGRKFYGECLNAWMIESVSAPKGFGPLLYDVAMEWATENGGGLMSDRYQVSDEAEGVWDFYLKNRASELEILQLDDPKNTLTPTMDDNCKQVRAGKNWKDKDNPLSKVFKKERATIRALEKLGLWISEEDFDTNAKNLEERCQKGYKTHPTRKTKKMFGRTYRNCVKAEGMDEEEITEADPKKGTGKKPKGSGRRLYTDENPKDTVSVKFRTVQDIKDTLSKESFKSKSHKRQSQIINLIHQRARAAYQNAKDPDTKARLKKAFDYAKERKEASKRKTQRMKKAKKEEIELSEKWSDKERKKRKSKCDNPKGFTMKQFCKNQRTRSKKGQKKN